MVNKITTPPTPNEIVGKINEIIDDKQDVLTSENAGNCIKIAVSDSLGLPSEYTQVEYLESSGTQYIDTGIVLKSKATITTVGRFMSITSNNPMTMWGFMDIHTNVPNIPRWGCSIYISRWLMDLNATASSVSADTNKHAFVNETNGTTYDGLVDGVSLFSKPETIPSPYMYKSNTLSAYIFARNNSNVAGNFSSSRIYSFNIVQDDIEVINLIPARRKSDNVLGMYDTVTGNFLTNAGTGTFIAGGDVGEVTKISFVNDAGYITSSALTGYATESYVTTAISNKQDTLVSGTNIKTINNTSILGSGNIDIQGGGTAYTAGDGIIIENDEISVDGEEVNLLTLATVAISGSYNDLSNKPSIPSVGNATITIIQGGVTKGSFTTNQSTNATIELDSGGGADVEAFTSAEVQTIWNGVL